MDPTANQPQFTPSSSLPQIPGEEVLVDVYDAKSKPDFPEPIPPKKPKKFILGAGIIGLVLVGVGLVLIRQPAQPNSKINPTPTSQVEVTPTPSASSLFQDTLTSPTPITNNWQTFSPPQTNLEIKYPPGFRNSTYLFQASPTPKASPPPAKTIFYIYNSALNQPYQNRYVALEILDTPPNFPKNQYSSFATEINQIPTTKYSPLDSTDQFDFYIIQTDSGELIQVSVANSLDKKQVANQILQTFSLTETPTPSASPVVESEEASPSSTPQPIK